MYRDLSGNYYWGTKNCGNVPIATGGAEKEQFTVQLSCLKSGKKYIPMIIFKGYPLTEWSIRNSIEVEPRYRLLDNSGNYHPPEDKVYLTSTKSASSSCEATVDAIWDVILPGIRIQYGKICGVLMDDFKGNSKDGVKVFTRTFLSGDDITHVEKRYKLCEWCVMDVGITCEKQPIDKFPGKFSKGNYMEQ